MGAREPVKNPRGGRREKPVETGSPPGREGQAGVQRLLEEETDKLIRHLTVRLPQAAAERPDLLGDLKERLYNYFNLNCRIMFNRYLAGPGDGEVREIQGFIGREETGLLTQYGSTGMADFLNAIARGPEGSAPDRSGGKTGAGAFVRGDHPYSVVKCLFRDNPVKPRTVTDVKFAVNIPDAGLLGPVFHQRAVVEYLVKDLIARHITSRIDREIEQSGDDRPRGSLFDRLAGLWTELDPGCFDQENIRENIDKLLDLETIRGRGFDRAADSLTSILDDSRLGYEYIENLENPRELIIREYEDTESARLPDERYQIRLRRVDEAGLAGERRAYDLQMGGFETEFRHLWELLEVIYQGKKPFFKVSDYRDLAQKERRWLRERKEKSGEPLYEDIAKVWDELSFVRPGEPGAERTNRGYRWEKERLRRKIFLTRNRLKETYGYEYPRERRIMEERLGFLEGEYDRFDEMVNPYQVQPGLLMEVDITSIKGKKITLDGMAGALNRFLPGLFRDFQDAASASLRDRSSEGFPAAPAPEPEEAPKRAVRGGGTGKARSRPGA